MFRTACLAKKSPRRLRRRLAQRLSPVQRPKSTGIIKIWHFLLKSRKSTIPNFRTDFLVKDTLRRVRRRLAQRLDPTRGAGGIEPGAWGCEPSSWPLGQICHTNLTWPKNKCQILIIPVDLGLCTGYNLCASRRRTLRGLFFTKKSVLKSGSKVFLETDIFFDNSFRFGPNTGSED